MIALRLDRLKARPWRTYLDVLSTCVVLLVSGVLLWRQFFPAKGGPPPLKTPSAPVSIDGAPLQGDPRARVVMIEFSEFQCPFCGNFARGALPEIKAAYVDTGKIQIAFRNLPLSAHQFAPKAAEAALCAGAQGRFWEMHDLLFVKSADLTDLGLQQHGNALNLSQPEFQTCLKGGMTERVRSDAAQARELGVAATPSFFIGTKQMAGDVKVRKGIQGVRPIAEFRAAIDQVLAETARYSTQRR